jgi:outer membrane protein TolC
MRRLVWILAAVTSVVAAGCAVGPNYKRPQVPVPNQWTVTPARGTSTNPPETEEWWSSFQDAELNSLITRAVDRNLDLKLALEHVQEARAARGIARSGYFPSVEATTSATRNRQRVIAPGTQGSAKKIVPVEFNNF